MVIDFVSNVACFSSCCSRCSLLQSMAILQNLASKPRINHICRHLTRLSDTSCLTHGQTKAVQFWKPAPLLNLMAPPTWRGPSGPKQQPTKTSINFTSVVMLLAAHCLCFLMFFTTATNLSGESACTDTDRNQISMRFVHLQLKRTSLPMQANIGSDPTSQCTFRSTSMHGMTGAR